MRKQMLAAALAGLVFGLGLVLSGLTRPQMIHDALDVSGPWDAGLMRVLLVSALTHGALLRWVRRRRAGPVLAPRFCVPERRAVDGRLVLGASLFGVGWAASGRCPGPGLVSLGAGSPAAVMFVAALLAGLVLARWLEEQLARAGAGRGRAPVRDVRPPA